MVQRQRFFDRVVDFLAGTGAVLVIGIMAIVCFEVVVRYVLQRPQLWVAEVSEYILVWITFLGAVWILREEGHVKVDILVGQLGPRAQTYLGIFASIIGIFSSLVLLLFGSKVVWGLLLTLEADSKSQIGIPKAPLLAIIPLCSLPLMVQFLRDGLKCMKKLKSLKHED
jgi:TRAP-type C4-dicarboxylate transport system permease small subunit